MSAGSDDYLAAEARARVDIDESLVACGWIVEGVRTEVEEPITTSVALDAFAVVEQDA